jgi:hypothetical protein
LEQMMGTDDVSETLVWHSTLTLQIARDGCVTFIHRESFLSTALVARMK